MGTALRDEDEGKGGGGAPGPAEDPAPSTAVRAAVLAKQLTLVLAMCAATALLIDYQNAGDPAFCGVESGCFAVRSSAYSKLFGVPLPNLALPAFALLCTGSIVAATVQAHRLVAMVAGVGALVAIALVAIQAAVVGAFCPWCVVVDSSAIVAGALAVLIALWVGNDAGRARRASLGSTAALAWGAAAVLAVGLPFLWARFPAVPPAPPEIVAEQQPGVVTIVSFTDFECPFCRQLHPTLDALRAQHKDKLRLVRKMKPLSGHPGAVPAAKAWLCAPEAQRDALAARLYEMEPEDFTPKKLVALAESFDVGGREAFAACMNAKATEEAIARDAALFTKVHGRGLPLTYVNGRMVVGLNPDRLVSSIDAELGAPPPTLPPMAMFAVLLAAAVAAAVLSWRAVPR